MTKSFSHSWISNSSLTSNVRDRSDFSGEMAGFRARTVMLVVNWSRVSRQS